MELCFPRASRSSHLPFIIPSIPNAYFWSIIVVWKIIDWQLPEAKALPISLYFSVVPFSPPKPKQWDTSPHAIQPGCASSSMSPLSWLPNSQLIVMSCRLMATPKAKTPSTSLFFDGARVGAPNKGTNSGAT